MRARRLLIAAPLCVLATAASAVSLGEALDAYGRGDYAAARVELGPRADGGSSAAQFFLGLIYARGRGVARDPVTALMWFDLAAARGFELAARAGADLAATMTSDERAEAARRARAWDAAHPAQPRGE